MKPYTVFGILLLLTIPFVSFASTANISKVVFTTDPQTVLPNEISGAITVQLQNSGGTEEKLDSTADVTFESTSGTGEFLGSTGKVITKTMSTGSANKTFYYRDSVEGMYMITVTVKSRTGSGEWKESQSVVVGKGSTGDNKNDSDTKGDGNNATTTDDGSNDVGDNVDVTVSTKTSSHGSSKKLSIYSKKSSIKVGAGRARTVLVNTPIYFEPETSETYKNSKSKKGDFIWSFGDGSSTYGRSVKHMYYFPGEYNVVLNTHQFGEEIVARTKVTVVEPSVDIVNVVTGDHGYVEIKNNSSSEVNINGWNIQSGKRKYMIADDTIINPRSSIKIPNKVLMFDPIDQVSFVFPNDEVHMVYSPKKTDSVIMQAPEPVYYPYSYEKPKSKVEKATEVSTSTKSDLSQTATVGNTGIVGKFWGGLKSLFLVH